MSLSSPHRSGASRTILSRCPVREADAGRLAVQFPLDPLHVATSLVSPLKGVVELLDESGAVWVFLHGYQNTATIYIFS